MTPLDIILIGQFISLLGLAAAIVIALAG